ncbi:MotA/TolQ/ExbB proton channel family protein [Telmatospirillum siberiense]|uniref:MotA/TolQ/ExbB proton channel family protein n=1 Tax=Telmatospirillum siberiense TaxID=382514 RepID=A0A2N3Q122_9PROT|nr:MotA/TolQ/ExbB proton channel family protein [Telmatospirillum siberiense]PKU26347.1 MotA/TolQ/ExbB proton channel family protein [Telmatospirillum siberiense]
METSVLSALAGLRAGGVFIYPLLAVGLLGVACIVDRIYVFLRHARLPSALAKQLADPYFAWDGVHRLLSDTPSGNDYVRFFEVIVDNAARPVWWIETRAADQAALTERRLDQGLWILETVVTAAPLLGLLGTISGMIGAFRLFGGTGAVDPGAVTGGVAEALIATAIGIVIALMALAAYNFFSHRRAIVLDEMERLGTRLIDRIRLDRGEAA